LEVVLCLPGPLSLLPLKLLLPLTAARQVVVASVPPVFYALGFLSAKSTEFCQGWM
jgi:hypothetical protein